MLPEAGHNQVVALDGPFAGGRPPEDIFADPVDDEPEPTRMHLVLLRDTEEEPPAWPSARSSCATSRAAARVDVSELLAEGTSPFQRIASLVGAGRLDVASTSRWLEGIDPTPVEAITELKAEVRR